MKSYSHEMISPGVSDFVLADYLFWQHFVVRGASKTNSSDEKSVSELVPNFYQLSNILPRL